MFIIGHAADEYACLAQLLFKTQLLACKRLLPRAQCRKRRLELAALCHRGKELALRVAAGILLALYFIAQGGDLFVHALLLHLEVFQLMLKLLLFFFQMAGLILAGGRGPPRLARKACVSAQLALDAPEFAQYCLAPPRRVAAAAFKRNQLVGPC